MAAMPGPNPLRVEIAERRLRNILRKHGCASSRTLEQKISDAGPYNQRVEPHVLTVARKKLAYEKAINKVSGGDIDWYYLSETEEAVVSARLAEQVKTHIATTERRFTMRVGQAAEIAVYKALLQQKNFFFFGGFPDIDEHDDSRMYRKEEPPGVVNGKSMTGKRRLDYLLVDKMAGVVGVEVKNIRAWMYPDREEIRDFLAKCVAVDAVPVLIARRLPYVTFSVLNRCGVVLHQFYNQRYPEADRSLADIVRKKTGLAYHDVKVGNEPDERLHRFMEVNLPQVIAKARERFDLWRDEIREYAEGEIGYSEFVAKLRGDYGAEDHDYEPEG